ncbi:hypothetical protein ACHWQZ_G016371 [Mnemiopsis leidyi]
MPQCYFAAPGQATSDKEKLAWGPQANCCFAEGNVERAAQRDRDETFIETTRDFSRDFTQLLKQISNKY